MGRHPGLIWSLVLLLVLGLGYLFQGVDSFAATVGHELLVLGLMGGALFLGFRGGSDGENSDHDHTGDP